MLPANAVILLMEADDVRRAVSCTIGAVQNAIKILSNVSTEPRISHVIHSRAYLNDPKTVASKLEIIRTVANAPIAKIEGLLAVEWIARISVGNRHIADR